jgi:alkylation response protein AidB-like acyl-CoA dehydrogenase
MGCTIGPFGGERDNVLGNLGGGLALTAASFFGCGRFSRNLRGGRDADGFDFALGFARNERRGGIHPIIEHQAVGYALVDAKMAIEERRAPSPAVPSSPGEAVALKRTSCEPRCYYGRIRNQH